jgi:hypothetical protein
MNITQYHGNDIGDRSGNATGFHQVRGLCVGVQTQRKRNRITGCALHISVEI